MTWFVEQFTKYRENKKKSDLVRKESWWKKLFKEVKALIRSDEVNVKQMIAEIAWDCGLRDEQTLFTDLLAQVK